MILYFSLESVSNNMNWSVYSLKQENVPESQQDDDEEEVAFAKHLPGESSIPRSYKSIGVGQNPILESREGE